MNILKPFQELRFPLEKISEKFSPNRIVFHLSSGIREYRGCSIERIDNDILIKPLNRYTELRKLSRLSKMLDRPLFETLMQMQEPQRLSIRHKNKIATYIHADLLLVLVQLQTHGVNKDLIEWLEIETGELGLENKLFRGQKEFSRSNIYTLNKNSVVVNMLGISSNTEKLTRKNRDLILQNPLINLIEITNGFSNKKLTEFLEHMNSVSVTVKEIIDKMQFSLTEDMKFTLKIRKIKRTHKRGMYIVEQNTILVDPRHVDSFTHELGHWYHVWFKKEILHVEDAEIFAENFNVFIKTMEFNNKYNLLSHHE